MEEVILKNGYLNSILGVKKTELLTFVESLQAQAYMQQYFISNILINLRPLQDGFLKLLESYANTFGTK